MAHVRKGDTVIVIAGSNKGKKGKVLRVNPETSRVTVEGVRLVTRHQKASGDQPGTKVTREAAIHVSNVALWNEGEGRRVKVASKVVDNKKVRVDRKTGAQIDG